MGQKSRQDRTVAPSPAKSPSSVQSATPARPAKSASSAAAAAPSSLPDIAQRLWANYVDRTPQRTKLLDSFLAFLVALGAVQFVYCVLAGNYPFNAFLAGFSATVGQFVLTVSLRIQTDPGNAKDFPSVSQERAFADYVLGSLILHFFCVNFVN